MNQRWRQLQNYKGDDVAIGRWISCIEPEGQILTPKQVEHRDSTTMPVDLDGS